MGKGPGLYSDIGKRARDLLSKDYNSDKKIAMTILSEDGVTLAASSARYGDFCLGDVSAQLKHNNVTTDAKLDTNLNLFTMVTVNELTPGLKTMLSFEVPDVRSGKLELQYLHDYAGICTSVGLTPNPIINFSGVLGDDKLALGSDVSFDTKVGAVTKCNFGTSFTNSNLIAALALNDKGDTLCASCYRCVSPLTNTVFGAEFVHSFSCNKNIISVGAQHKLNPLTTIKARLDNFGRVNTLIQRAWCPEVLPKSAITLSTEVDLKARDQDAKIGLAFVIEP